MKANNGKGNNPARDEWETPKSLFKNLKKQYHFDFDCCATKKNTKCSTYTSNFELITKCNTKCSWMNPPFSKALLMFKTFFNIVKRGVAIYRCDNMETKIWQYYILPNASWIFIPNKRIAYEGMEGNGSRFPSALIGLRVDTPKHIGGIILIPKK